MPYVVHNAAAIITSGAVPTLTELDNMPQVEVEMLGLVNEVRHVIEYGLEV